MLQGGGNGVPCGPLQVPAQGVAAASMLAGGWQQRAPRSLKVFLSGAERGWWGLTSWGAFPPLTASGTKLQERDSAMGTCVLIVGPLVLPVRRDSARVSSVPLAAPPAARSRPTCHGASTGPTPRLISAQAQNGPGWTGGMARHPPQQLLSCPLCWQGHNPAGTALGLSLG